MNLESAVLIGNLLPLFLGWNARPVPGNETVVLTPSDTWVPRLTGSFLELYIGNELYRWVHFLRVLTYNTLHIFDRSEKRKTSQPSADNSKRTVPLHPWQYLDTSASFVMISRPLLPLSPVKSPMPKWK